MAQPLRVLEAEQVRDVGEGVVGLGEEALDGIDQRLAQQLARRLAGRGFDPLFQETARDVAIARQVLDAEQAGTLLAEHLEEAPDERVFDRIERGRLADDQAFRRDQALQLDLLEASSLHHLGEPGCGQEAHADDVGIDAGKRDARGAGEHRVVVDTEHGEIFRHGDALLEGGLDGAEADLVPAAEEGAGLGQGGDEGRVAPVERLEGAGLAFGRVVTQRLVAAGGEGFREADLPFARDALVAVAEVGEVAVALLDEMLCCQSADGAVVAVDDEVLAGGIDEGSLEVDDWHALLAQGFRMPLVGAGGDHAVAFEIRQPVRFRGRLAAVFEVELPVVQAAEAGDPADQVPPVLRGGFNDDRDVPHGGWRMRRAGG